MKQLGDLPKLLVLGSLLPGSKDGGGVVKDEVLTRYPKDRYVCYAVDPGSGNGNKECGIPTDGVPCLVGPLVPSLRMRGARFYMPLLRAFGYTAVAPLRIHQVAQYAKQHKVDLIWAELQYDALLLAEEVSRKAGIPFVGTVWDDPEGWFSDRGHDRLSRWLLRKRFKSALRAAQRISTAGEAMQRTYEREYGVGSVILRHGFERPATRSERSDSRREIIVGYVGSLYGRDAWQAFLSAAARLNSSGKYQPIRLRIFGGAGFPFRHDGIEVEIRGWQPQDRMLEEIAECDFCYLTYWFEPKKRRHVELSFPNKFETYLAAGRPVLYHGPAYAGIAEAVRQYGVGMCIHSLEEGEIQAKLISMISDQHLRDSFEKAAYAAFHAEFNAQTMMNNFSALIGIDPALLRDRACE
jgi:glycosyltransferase involved in cell wall biosynthesis